MKIAPLDRFLQLGPRGMVQRAFIAVVLTLSLSTYQYFPGMRAVQDGWLLVCVLSLFTLYPILKVRVDWTFSSFELYLLAMVPFLILSTTIAAWLQFDQPVWYGALAQRSLFLVAIWLIFINAWRLKWLRLDNVQPVMVFLIWSTFAVYTFLRLALNPVNYATPGFTSGTGVDVSFSPPGVFLIFGVLYYALRGVREARLKYYVYSAILLTAALGASGRSLSLTLAGTILFFLFRWQNVKRLVLTLSSMAVLLAIALGSLQILNPDSLKASAARYGQAFQAISGGTVTDPSSIARVYETQLALPYIYAHPLFGIGQLSGQWHGTNSDFFGGYFFPDDIGLIGAVFTYGFVGLLLCLGQYFFAISATRHAPSEPGNPLLDGVKGMVLTQAIGSLTSGQFAFDFQGTSFFIMLLILLASDARAKQERLEEAALPQLQFVS